MKARYCKKCGVYMGQSNYVRCAGCRKLARDRKKQNRENRRRMLRRIQSAQCYWCGRYVHKGCETIDHVVPVSEGGSKTSIKNMVMSCKHCNGHRGTMPAKEWAKRCGVLEPTGCTAIVK